MTDPLLVEGVAESEGACHFCAHCLASDLPFWYWDDQLTLFYCSETCARLDREPAPYDVRGA